MAIARKPQPKTQAKLIGVPTNEKKVMELIEKGAKREIVQVFFRAPAEIMERADQAAKARTIPTTRQNWLLEAILEKLEREGNGQ
jgi:hypothetical protein